MQKTFDFCVSTGLREESDGSAENSLDPESSEENVTDTQTSTASGTEASEAPVTCLGACCKPVRTEPNQPRSRDIFDATTKTINGQKRSVSASWFDRYTWLTLCETRNVLLCHYCVEADRRCLITFSTKRDAFVRNGFSRWKNALERFSKHEATSTHKEAVLKLHSAARVKF